MSDEKTTNLSSITGANLADNDLVMVVDVSDMTMAATGTNKKVTLDEFAQDSTFSSRYVPQADDKIWLDAADMSVCSGSPTNGPWTSTRWNVWSLDAASSESVSGGVFIPSWWTTYHVDIVWGNDGAGSGDVRFALAYWDMDAGDNALTDWAGPLSLTATAGLNEIVVVSRILTSQTYAIGKPCKFQLFRDGANAADTLTNDCAVAGLLFTRAS